jgi:biopolymer transport protein ExbD
VQVRQPRSKSAKLICTIDVTAFAGVMFALVAMFLLPAMVVVDSPRDAAHAAVDLAKASNLTDLQGALREDALFVAVQRDGHTWFGRDQIKPENLPAAIRERVSHGAERKVYIRADMHAKYGTVLEVLSGVRSAGIENVAFLVNERNSRPTP